MTSATTEILWLVCLHCGWVMIQLWLINQAQLAKIVVFLLLLLLLRNRDCVKCVDIVGSTVLFTSFVYALARSWPIILLEYEVLITFQSFLLFRIHQKRKSLSPAVRRGATINPDRFALYKCVCLVCWHSQDWFICWRFQSGRTRMPCTCMSVTSSMWSESDHNAKFLHRMQVLINEILINAHSSFIWFNSIECAKIVKLQ